MLRVFALLAGFFLASCAMQPVETTKVAGIKTIGILPAAETSSLAVQTTGVMVFGNEYGKSDIDWSVNDMFASELGKQLTGRYEVKILSERAEKFKSRDNYYFPSQQGMFTPSRPSIGELAQQELGDEKLDAYIIVTLDGGRVVNTNQAVFGAGLFRRQRMIGTDNYYAFVGYSLTVLDGQNFKVIGDMRAKPVGASVLSAFSSSELDVPNLPVPREFYYYPNTYHDRIRETISLVIQNSVPDTLQRLRLK